ncbi:MAG TPA: hypothetical protein VIL99_17605 [Ignavibacteria bacterium]
MKNLLSYPHESQFSTTVSHIFVWSSLDWETKLFQYHYFFYKHILVIKLTFLILILCFSFNVLVAQSNEEKLMSIYTDFYSQNNLSAYSCGMGLTGIAGNNDISGITLNPASICIKNKYEIITEFSYKSGINYYNIDGSENYIRQIHPAVGIFFGYKINKKFQTGLSYRNGINLNGDFGEFSNINGVFDISESYYTHTLTIPFVYRTDIFSAGVNFNYIFYEGNFTGPQRFYADTIVNLKTTFGRIAPDFGIQINPINEITIGLTYTQGFDKNIVREWSSVDHRLTNDTTLARYPSKFGIGIQARLLENLLKIEINYRFENTSKAIELNNRNNFNFGLDFSINNNWNIRTGFFTQLFGHENNTVSVGFKQNYDQYFITFGTGYTFKFFKINLSFMNSSLLSESKAAHSEFNFGIGSSF